MSKRPHNFGTKRFKEKSLFIFHARIALKSLILLFVRLIARGARIGKIHTHTHTHTHTDRQDKYCNPRACAPRVNNCERSGLSGLFNARIFYIILYPVRRAVNVLNVSTYPPNAILHSANINAKRANVTGSMIWHTNPRPHM